MIQKNFKPLIKDNSGATSCLCIQKKKKRFSKVYTLPLTVTLKQVRSQSKIEKGTISKGIIIQSKRKTMRMDGTSIKFDKTAISLTDKGYDPKGSELQSLSLVEFHTPHSFKFLSLGSPYL